MLQPFCYSRVQDSSNFAIAEDGTSSRLLKKTHMAPACLKQAFRIVALDRCGNHSRSKQSRSNVPRKYADPRRFFARLASEIFLTNLQSAFFNSLLVFFDLAVHNFPVGYGSLAGSPEHAFPFGKVSERKLNLFDDAFLGPDTLHCTGLSLS